MQADRGATVAPASNRSGQGLAFLLLFLAIVFGPPGHAALPVLITIDTETSSDCSPAGCFPAPMSERIFAVRDGTAYGIPLMMDMLERHDMRGTFFINAYLDAYYPEAEVADMVAAIIRRGHDVQFHAHEEFRCFRVCAETDLACRQQCVREDSFLGGNSYDNQLAILQEGAANIARWSGRYPVAFRGGGYDADETTLRALSALGIGVDSSLSGPDHELARVLPVNRLGRYAGVLEIPLLAYRENILVSKRFRHLDIESSTLLEQKAVLADAVELGLPAAVIMMHSFSFCRDGEACPHTRKISRFEALLQHIKVSPDLRVMTVLDYWESQPEVGDAANTLPSMPEVGYWLTLYRAFVRIDEGGMNAAFALANLAVLVGLLGGGYGVYRFTRRRRTGPTTAMSEGSA